MLGSAVNPVLREGNSDRRVAQPVKDYAKKHPHSMGSWSKNSQTHVAHMKSGDFFSSEQSAVQAGNGFVNIVLETLNGETLSLKKDITLLQGEVIDAAVMSRSALTEFFDPTVSRSHGLSNKIEKFAVLCLLSGTIIVYFFF